MTINKKASLLFLLSTLLYLLLSLFLVFLGSFGSLDENLLFLLNSIAVSVPAFLIPALVFRRTQRFPVFKAPHITHVLIAFVIGLGCVFLNQALTCLNEAIFMDVRVVDYSTDAYSVLELDPVVMVIALGILPPVCEEFIMRGTLLESWRRSSPVGAALLTAFLFGLLHAAPSSLMIYFGLGVLFALVYLITRNVWLTVIVHMVNNFASVIIAIALQNGDYSASLTGNTYTILNMSDLRAAYIGEFIYTALIAGALIVPMMFVLRTSCRRRGKGKYAYNYDSLADGREFESYSDLLDDPIAGPEEEKGRPSLLGDLFLWIAMGLLLALNIVTGLSEFGVITLE